MRPVRSDGQVGGGRLMGKQSIDLEHAKELWDEWEIHCLILVSLFLQVLLFLVADMRRRSGSWMLMTVLWLAYLLADTVAIFVLGHLAVYVEGPNHELMFFWAPFVLVHLGGQDSITAFSKQDNELWTRHLLSLVSQVAVAGYVVSKSSWPDVRLRAAMVLMFISGFIKYVGRTYCLYTASPKNIGDIILLSLSRTIRRLQDAKAKDIPVHKAREYIKRRFEEMFIADRLWKDVRDTPIWINTIMSVDAPVNDVNLIKVANELPDMLEKFKNRPDRSMAYQYVAAHLIKSYRVLYTKTWFIHPSLDTTPTIWTIANHFKYVSTAIALALFATVAEKKRRYSQADIIVSYVLLIGAIVLDLLPVFTSIVSCARKPFRPGNAAGWAKLCLVNCIVPQGWQTTKQWSEELAQYSMIRRYCTSNTWIPSLLKWIVVKCFGAWCVELFDMTRTPVTDDLKLLVLDKLLLETSRQEWDISSSRGERALGKWMDIHTAPELGRSCYAALHMSVSSSRVDFPRSILIWHITTDICYFLKDKGPNEVKKKKKLSRELSLYIMYLVFKCDVMLTSFSRLAHKQAHNELTEIISGRQSPKGNIDEKEAIMEVFEALNKEEQQQGSKPEVAHVKNNEESGNKDAAANTGRMLELMRSTEEALYSPVLSRAHAVAKELMTIDDEAARWDLISEVWLEMLFYIAPRCGAAFHYEHLSTGGEFISHVLLLMHELGPFMPKPDA